MSYVDKLFIIWSVKLAKLSLEVGLLFFACEWIFPNVISVDGIGSI